MNERIHSAETIPTPTLRKAVAEDLPFLFRVSTEAMESVVKTLNPEKEFNEEHELSEYEKKFTPDKIDVIQFEGRDVGRLRIVRTQESIYVGGIQILPEYQEKGIGTYIFSELIKESNTTGIPIVLEVHDVNEKAISFYKKLGFTAGGKQPNKTVMNYIPRV